jgi:hypothetical protein
VTESHLAIQILFARLSGHEREALRPELVGVAREQVEQRASVFERQVAGVVGRHEEG